MLPAITGGRRRIRGARAMLADPTVTVGEVREALGVSEGTFYSYFPGGRQGT